MTTTLKHRQIITSSKLNFCMFLFFYLKEWREKMKTVINTGSLNK